MKPVAYDLCCGLFGWGAAFIQEGYRVVGYDIVDMHKELSLPRPNEVELIIQDILTLHGSRCRDAAVIVASPPCQKYSYMAMPWKKAKALAAWYRESLERVAELNALFNACFRIQREASEAAGRHIPLIVENVRGAQPWVGRSTWNFGSYHLWGDVPALMPIATGRKNNGGSWYAVAHNTTSGHSQSPVNGCKGIPHRTSGHWTNPAEHERGVKGFTPKGEPLGQNTLGRAFFSTDPRRKAASAMIAKIPFPLAQHIAKTFYFTSEVSFASTHNPVE